MLTMHEEMVRDFFLHVRSPSSESYEGVEAVDELVRADPVQGWNVVRKLIEMAASDDELGYVAAGPLEDLLYKHGVQIAAAIRSEALGNGRVRDALARVMLDPRPAEVEAALGEWLLPM